MSTSYRKGIHCTGLKSKLNEYEQMLDILSAVHPKRIGDVEFSFDKDHNSLASSGLSSSGKNEMLDYALYSRNHRQPYSSQYEILRAQGTSSKKDKLDLSDNFPVQGTFSFK
jgi:hypothetical protein